MRFLIVFATALACASAAPSHSHLLPYAAYSAIPAIPIHALHTATSGDIQAAAIDARVKAADLAQEYVDQARLVSDQVADNLNTQVISAVDQSKQRLADAFWSTEDQKWQAFAALKNAEAQIDSAIASKANIWAKTAVAAPYGVYGAAVAPVATAASVGSVLHGAPALKSYSTQTIIHSLSEASKAEADNAKAEADSVKVEAAAKAADLAMEAEAQKSAEAAASNAAAELKSKADEALAALKSPVIAPVAVADAFSYNAAIDAQVKAADLNQEYADKARLVSEQAAENLNTQVINAVGQNEERLANAFWATEDKKWQALDALKTAEAQIDGAIASKADIWAKTAVAGYPYSGLSVAPAWSSAVAPAWSSGIAPVLSSGVASAWSSDVASGLASAIAPTVALTSPGFKYASTVQHIGPLATSTLLKTPC